MIYYRCKCGKHESWSSMGTRACEGCRTCNTTLASGPEEHISPVPPHELARVRVAADEGEAYRMSCLNCHRRISEIEQRGEPWAWFGGSIEAATR